MDMGCAYHSFSKGELRTGLGHVHRNPSLGFGVEVSEPEELVNKSTVEQYARTLIIPIIIWVVVKIRAPFWVPNIIRLTFGVPKKGP